MTDFCGKVTDGRPMAGEWIKMRVWLSRHPKVIAMADHLARSRAFMDWLTDPVHRTCDETAYEHVTRNVTVSVTVASLLQVWGVANDVGKPHGDDLILSHATLERLDEIAGVPSFGDAMHSVGWATQSEKNSVTFPEFLLYNTPAEDRSRQQNRDRQRRYRETKRNVTGNATGNVTNNAKRNAREEKSREESNTKKSKPKDGSKPTVEDVRAYCLERKNSVDPEAWMAHYEANGWKIGRNPMKDWRAAVRTWERNQAAKAAIDRTPTDADLANWNPVDGGLGT